MHKTAQVYRNFSTESAVQMEVPPLSMKTLPYLLLASVACAADPSVPAGPITVKGRVLLEETFDRAQLGDWKPGVPTFGIESGTLRGTQTRADHGATIRIERPIQNGVVEFRFQMEGAGRFNAVFDDRQYKGSHAGHICRVAFQPNLIRLGDDKEGIMRNDLYAMKDDPKRKKELDSLLAGRSATHAVAIEPGHWHHASIEIQGDTMRVCVDGKPTGFLQSPGLSHPSKALFGFTVSGGSALFDDVRIWSAAP